MVSGDGGEKRERVEGGLEWWEGFCTMHREREGAPL